VPGAEERKAGGFRNGSGVTVSKCSKTFPPAVVGIGDEEQVIACRGDADIIPSTCDVCELCPKGFAGKDPQQLPVRRRAGVDLEILKVKNKLVIFIGTGIMVNSSWIRVLPNPRL